MTSFYLFKHCVKEEKLLLLLEMAPTMLLHFMRFVIFLGCAMLCYLDLCVFSGFLSMNVERSNLFVTESLTPSV